MCIVFMAGFPASGKSFIVEKFVEKIQDKLDVLTIDPKLLKSDNYDTLSEDKKRGENIAAWIASLDFLSENICINDNSKVIVYDTCCASTTRMLPVFELAREKGHKIIYVFVNADEDTRRRRAGENILSDDVISKYKWNLAESVTVLSKLADRKVVIDNTADGEPRVGKIIKEILWLLNLQTLQVT